MVWDSGTKGLGGTYIRMEEDGNLVMYDSQDRAVWASNSGGDESGKPHLEVTNEGHLQITSENGHRTFWKRPE